MNNDCLSIIISFCGPKETLYFSMLNMELYLRMKNTRENIIYLVAKEAADLVSCSTPKDMKLQGFYRRASLICHYWPSLPQFRAVLFGQIAYKALCNTELLLKFKRFNVEGMGWLNLHGSVRAHYFRKYKLVYYE